MVCESAHEKAKTRSMSSLVLKVRMDVMLTGMWEVSDWKKHVSSSS